MKLNKFAFLSGVALLSMGILNTKNAQAVAATNNLVTKTVMHDSIVYDKDGNKTSKRYKAYQHVEVTTPITINSEQYYKIGENQYIKVTNIDGSKRKVIHNAYVYATSNKRANKVVYKKGQIIVTYGGSYKFKNGKKYYRVGGPSKQYVKAYNLSSVISSNENTNLSNKNEKEKSNEEPQVSTGTLITKSAIIYDKDGKPFMGEITNNSAIGGAEGNKFFRSGTKLNYYGIKTISGQVYYSVGNGMYIKKSEIREIEGQILIKLKKGSKIYDKSGKVISTKLPEDDLLKYTGQVNDIEKATKYYFINSEGQPQELPVVTIKGNDYYSLGNKQYIKVTDVKTINGNKIFTNYLTVTTTKTAPLYDMNGKKTQESIAKNKTVQVEREIINPQNVEDIDDTGWTYYFYKIKGEDKLINLGDVNDQNPTFPPYYFDKNSPVNLAVSFPKDTTVYDDKGEIKYQGWSLPHTNGGSYHVVKLVYIYIPSEKKAELFYEMASHHLRLQSNDKVMKGEDTGTSYVKASDTSYYDGIRLIPSNTPEQAKTAYEASLKK